MSSVGSFVTKENIKKKENERQRLSDINKLLFGDLSITKTTSSGPNQSETFPQSSLTGVLRKLQCGQVTCQSLRSHMNHHRCLTLQPDKSQIINYGHNQSISELDSLQKMLATSNRGHLVCVWSLKSSIAQCLQLLSVSPNLNLRHTERKSASQNGLTVAKPLISGQPIFKKITSLCWAKFPVFYTTTCPMGYAPAVLHGCSLDLTRNTSMSVFEMSLGFSTVWSSAWHHSKPQFSVGSDCKCHLIDVTTRRLWTYYTRGSDALAQTFSCMDSNRLYVGNRGGYILVHDIRCPGKSQSRQEMRQKPGIGCLRLLQDENFLMASDFSGDIVTWDQRMARVVMRYEGLVNSHYQLPFHLDEQESIVCAAGSDNYTKLWDLQTGALLRSIPPPCPATVETFSSAIYSQRWGNSNGNSALLVGIGNQFKVYS